MINFVQPKKKKEEHKKEGCFANKFWPLKVGPLDLRKTDKVKEERRWTSLLLKEDQALVDNEMIEWVIIFFVLKSQSVCLHPLI